VTVIDLDSYRRLKGLGGTKRRPQGYGTPPPVDPDQRRLFRLTRLAEDILQTIRGPRFVEDGEEDEDEDHDTD